MSKESIEIHSDLESLEVVVTDMQAANTYYTVLAVLHGCLKTWLERGVNSIPSGMDAESNEWEKILSTEVDRTRRLFLRAYRNNKEEEADMKAFLEFLNKWFFDLWD